MYSRGLATGPFGRIAVWTVISGKIENGNFHSESGEVFELPNSRLIYFREG
jgi:hypothetical protein